MSFQLYDLVDWCSQTKGRAFEKSGQIVQVIAAGQMPDQQRFASLYSGKGAGKARDAESYVVCVDGVRVYWPRTSALRPSASQMSQKRASRQWTDMCRESLWEAQARAELLEEFLISRSLMAEFMAFTKRRAGYARTLNCRADVPVEAGKAAKVEEVATAP